MSYNERYRKMKKYDVALFDLDGTLSESGEGILDCVRIVFEEMKRPLPDEKTLASFIGPPLTDSLKRCGFSEKDAEKGLQIYKKNFVETGIYKNKVYEGMYETLQALKENGVLLGVATTKYQPFADRIIKMLKLDSYFDFVGGSMCLTISAGIKKPSCLAIQSLMQRVHSWQKWILSAVCTATALVRKWKNIFPKRFL